MPRPPNDHRDVGQLVRLPTSLCFGVFLGFPHAAEGMHTDGHVLLPDANYEIAKTASLDPCRCIYCGRCMLAFMHPMNEQSSSALISAV